MILSCLYLVESRRTPLKTKPQTISRICDAWLSEIVVRFAIVMSIFYLLVRSRRPYLKMASARPRPHACLSVMTHRPLFGISSVFPALAYPSRVLPDEFPAHPNWLNATLTSCGVFLPRSINTLFAARAAA